MSIEQIILLVGLAGLAVVILCAALVAAWVARRRAREGVPPAAVDDVRPGSGLSIQGPRNAADEAALEAPRPGTYDRVVRVVALLFLAAVGVVVAVTHAYPSTEVAIYLLLASGIFFVIFMQDLLPAGALGQLRYWFEALAAILALAVLLGLTGGLTSPFFVGFFLVVGGASLSVEGGAPLALAALAGLAYAIVALLVAPNGIGVGGLAWIGFNLVALALLAYIASVAGREQREAREAALRLSRFDPLTALYNRNYFFAVMDREIRRSARIGRGFTVLMLDLDDLKPVNDTFGHQYGDRLLRAVTDVLERNVRASDVAARYGGDEFVVLLPETDPSGAFIVAEKLRADIASLALRVDDRAVRTSVSIGLVAYPDDGATIEALVAAVDAAMYKSKRRGKNQIVGYTTLTERVTTSAGPFQTEAAASRAPVTMRPATTTRSGPPTRAGSDARGRSEPLPGRTARPMPMAPTMVPGPRPSADAAIHSYPGPQPPRTGPPLPPVGVAPPGHAPWETRTADPPARPVAVRAPLAAGATNAPRAATPAMPPVTTVGGRSSEDGAVSGDTTPQPDRQYVTIPVGTVVQGTDASETVGV